MKRNIIKFFLISIIQLGQSGMTQGADFLWQPGEELFYSVKWGFITLGKLHLQTIEADTLNNSKVFLCRMYVDSSPYLPFISIHDIYESYVDSSRMYSHRYLSYEDKGDYILYTEYVFNYPEHQVMMKIEKRGDEKIVLLLDSVTTISEKVFDGLSILYFARAMSKKNEYLTVPVFIYNKFEYADIHFTGTQKILQVKNQKLSGFYLDGLLKFVGFAGLKEGFRGWFSPDRQSIPLKALMKAFIGHVKIELREWKNWKGALF
jgi:hypothetical protein